MRRGFRFRRGLKCSQAIGGDLFGGAVNGAGDVDNDGFADVIIGATENDAGGNAAHPFQCLSPDFDEDAMTSPPTACGVGRVFGLALQTSWEF